MYFGAKGSGGNNVCGLCKNIYGHKCSRVPDPTGFAISSATIDTSMFDLWTDQELKEATSTRPVTV